MFNSSGTPTVSTTENKQDTLDIDGYRIVISTADSLDHLKKTWVGLEGTNRAPFFLTWHWISCWIKTYNPNLISVRAIYQGKVVAIGLFTSSMETRHGFIRSHQLRLHQMGNILMDQIWMEYNDFIGDESHRVKAVNACLKAMQQDSFQWDEIILSMMSSERAKIVAKANTPTRMESCQPCFSVNLAQLRHNEQEYLQTLHGNTRYQIRRSIRLYEKLYGPLELKKAENSEQALNFFHHAGTFHIQRWSDSGYKNRLFVKFHENLIEDCFEDSNLVLLKLQAGKETIAIMYYHIVGKTVYFYLHGLKYDGEKKLKPGLVAHTFATRYFIQLGMDEYDFMGGYSQYKEQLAQHTNDQVCVVIQRPRSRFSLERIATDIKNRIIGLTKVKSITPR